MIKFFDSNSGWAGKWNWVDDNNLVVGFSSSLQCCETFGFVWRENNEDITDSVGDEQKDYSFDPNYFFYEEDEDDWISNNTVTFRAVAEGKPDRYLTLFNTHNGYYSHGFTLSGFNKGTDGAL